VKGGLGNVLDGEEDVENGSGESKGDNDLNGAVSDWE